jgi:hypothetical protein
VSPHDPSVSDVVRRWRELPLQGGPSLREFCGGDEVLYERVLAALWQEPTALDPHAPPTVPAPPAVPADAPTVTTDLRGQKCTFADLPRPEVPGYEVLGYLGRGGWGVVFKARDVRLGREVALKLLTPAGVYQPQVRERFIREGRALARLDHPNVVPIYDAGDAGQLPYFAMKYVPGGTLAAAACRVGCDLRHAVRLIAKVSRAVQYLHDRGVVHRDLKPANILLDPDDEPMVADFGMAKWLEDDRELTSAGAVLGTRLYMAPEQAAGDTDATGPACDVWALGVILYELLTGRRPFDHKDVVELERQIRSEPPPPLTDLRPDVPAPLADVVGRCLAKSPGDRYPTATAVADDLDLWAATGVIPWRRDPGPGRRRAIALGSTLAVGALLLMSAPRPAETGPQPRDTDPTPTLAERVSRGEEVVLIGATGLPPPRTVLTDKDGFLRPDSDGLAVLHGPNYLAAELTDEPLPPRFELSAEVAPDPGLQRSARFGVFAGRRRWESPAGPVDRMVVAGVTGRLYTAARGGLANTFTRGNFGVVWFQSGREPAAVPLAWGPDSPDPFPPPDGNQPPKWYRVSLRVIPDQPPQGTCEGVVFEAKPTPAGFPSAWLTVLANQRRQADPRADDPPLLGTGAGVYVLFGTARFRNVVLKPF